jgi:DNA-binding transcriptional ArsR family regulator
VAETPDVDQDFDGDAELVSEPTPKAATRRPAKTAAGKSPRAARGAAREAILAALEHGSHTVGELSVVTAMSGPNINGNLRRLAAEGVVVKTEREGKAAWALAQPVA